MAIYRIHSEQGIIADIPGSEKEFIRFMETRTDREIKRLVEGAYHLGPSWATKHHYNHTFIVKNNGTGIYTATPRTERSLLRKVATDATSYTEHSIRIPEDQIYALVAGPIRDYGPIGI